MRYWLMLIALVLVGHGQAQTTLRGTLPDCNFPQLYVHAFYGMHIVHTDTVPLRNGTFTYYTPQEEGYYRVAFNDTNYVDLILSPDVPTAIQLTGTKLKEIVIEQSEENRLLFNFKAYKKDIDHRLRNIDVQLSFLVETDTLYHALLALKEVVNNEFYTYANKVFKDHPNTYFTATTRPFIHVKNDCGYATQHAEMPRDKYVKKHFFDAIDFSNPALTRTTLLPNIYMKYFEGHVQYNEFGFKQAIDIILNKASANNEVYDLTLAYLMELFDKVGPKIIFEHIVENYYRNESCFEHFQDASFVFNAEAYRKLRIGSIAPDMAIPNAKGQIKTLSEVAYHHQLTLVFFWSSHCSFCKATIPELKKTYAAYKDKGFEIYAVSLDDDPTAWKSAIAEYDLEWINVSSVQGWKAEEVNTFLISKTPTLYLLDRERTIKGKNLQADTVELLLRHSLE